MGSEGTSRASERTSGERFKRALARRFPRSRIVYNFVRAKAGHYLSRLRPGRSVATARWLARLVGAVAARRREPRLTVAVDVTAFWEPLTGIGWSLYRLLEHLADSDEVRLRLYGPTVVDSPDLEPPTVDLPRGPALERVLYETNDDLIVPRGLVIRLLRLLQPLLLALDGNEVLFAPNYFLPRRFLLAGGARVSTVHDLGLHKVPETLQAETLADLRSRLEHTTFEAARLITVSGAVRDELAELGYAGRERVRPVHHGPGQLSEVTPTSVPAETPSPYALHVGTLEPRKNILALLEAWRILQRSLPHAPPLVLCGRYGWKTEEIRREVERASEAGWVRHLGYVDEGELAALYRDATLVVFPSRYEGFGLPAVEALWAGTPLVCSDLPVLREVAGDAALFAPADRPEELAQRVKSLLTDRALREEMAARGRARIEHFSWNRAAREALEVWAQAAGRRVSGDDAHEAEA